MVRDFVSQVMFLTFLELTLQNPVRLNIDTPVNAKYPFGFNISLVRTEIRLNRIDYSFLFPLTFRVTVPVFRLVNICKSESVLITTSILARYCKNGMSLSSRIFLTEHQMKICLIFGHCFK